MGSRDPRALCQRLVRQVRRGSPPGDDKYLGKIRLEAATGQDFSPAVDIPKPDGMQERALQLVKWLAKENPQGKWGYFLTDGRQGPALGPRDHGRQLARLDDRGALRRFIARRSRRDVLRARDQ